MVPYETAWNRLETPLKSPGTSSKTHERPLQPAFALLLSGEICFSKRSFWASYRTISGILEITEHYYGIPPVDPSNVPPVGPSKIPNVTY